MSRAPKKKPKRPRPVALSAPPPADFEDVLRLIDAARGRAVAAVNQELIDLYWNVGEHISRKIAADGWGEGTVEELAEYIRRRQPNARGFSARNLWRMMQFYETYRDRPKLSPGSSGSRVGSLTPSDGREALVFQAGTDFRWGEKLVTMFG
jgi:hypothetical protein